MSYDLTLFQSRVLSLTYWEPVNAENAVTLIRQRQGLNPIYFASTDNENSLRLRTQIQHTLLRNANAFYFSKNTQNRDKLTFR